MDQQNSALLLDVIGIENPTWTAEVNAWAAEPQRRIRHSAASSAGKVWIVGGERADGSGIGFSDHFVFDPTVPSFASLPTTNAPPDIFGHTSIVLLDGRMVVFGGYCQSQGQLLPFSSIWALSTTQMNMEWSMIPVSNASLPNPRMAFTATLLEDGRVLIQGGADAALQVNFDDGWILDTSKIPMEWNSIQALSQLGARRDHFAISVDNQVVFGFGEYIQPQSNILTSHCIMQGMATMDPLILTYMSLMLPLALFSQHLLLLLDRPCV